MEASVDSQTPLALIRDLLEEEDFSTELVQQSEGQPFERLLVSLGADDKHRPFTLQMHFVNDVTGALGGFDDPEDIFLLECFLPFPFQAKPEYQTETARVLLALNRLLPIGAMGMSEPDGTVYIQYNLACLTRATDEKVLLEVVGMMGFFTGEFGPKIEAIGDGSLSRETYLADLANAGIQLPPLGKVG